MPKRIVKNPIQLFRDGQFVTPPVGSVIDLTIDELESLNKANPDALDFILTVEAPLVANPVASVEPVVKKARLTLPKD